MALTYSEYTVTSTAGLLSVPIPFSYISESDVELFLDGVAQTLGTHYTFTTSSTLGLTTAAPYDTFLRIQRRTNSTEKAVNFQTGAMLTEKDLDTAIDQVFNLSQETRDIADYDFGTVNQNVLNLSPYLDEIEAIGSDLGSGAITTVDYGDLTSTTVTPSSDSVLLNIYNNLGTITSVNTNEPNINTVASNEGAVQTVSTNIQNVISVSDPSFMSAVQNVNAASPNINLIVSNLNAVLNAGQAALEAEAALDSLTDIYLGRYSTPPTFDNDGDPLVAGTLYYDELTNIVMVFTGSAWQGVTASEAIQSALDNKLDKTGGTLSGLLDMALNRISNLATPTLSADAVTKTYADDIELLALAGL